MGTHDMCAYALCQAASPELRSHGPLGGSTALANHLAKRFCGNDVGNTVRVGTMCEEASGFPCVLPTRKAGAKLRANFERSAYGIIRVDGRRQRVLVFCARFDRGVLLTLRAVNFLIQHGVVC